MLLVSLLVKLALWSSGTLIQHKEHHVHGRLFFHQNKSHSFHLTYTSGTAYLLTRCCHVPASWQVALHFYHAVQVGLAKRKMSKVNGLAAKRF